MAYDEELAARIRARIDVDAPEMSERKMFGGLAFLIDGNMAVVASGQGGIMIRVDPDESDRLLATTAATRAEMRGRPMRGWLRVADEHLTTESELNRWVDRSMTFAQALPPET